MEHTYTHRSNTQSEREHRLLSFQERPGANDAPKKSGAVNPEDMQKLMNKVDALGQKLQERAGARRVGGEDPESDMKNKILAISGKYEADSQKVIGIMKRNTKLQGEAAAALEAIMNTAETEMRAVETSVQKIINVKRSNLEKQKERYATKREKVLGKEAHPNERTIEYAEIEARTTLGKIDSLTLSIEKLLPLASETTQFSEELEGFLIMKVDILADLSKFQGKRRDELEAVPGAPKTAVMARLEAAENHVGIAGNALRVAETSLRTPDISSETTDALREKKDALFHSMADVFVQRTTDANEAHAGGKISLSQFEAALAEEMDFLKSYDRNDRLDNFGLGVLVNTKAESLVDKANDPKKEESARIDARAEARNFITKYDDLYISDPEKQRLFTKISDAETAEASAKVETKEKTVQENLKTQMEAAQKLIERNPILDLSGFMEETVAVLAHENLGQYFRNDDHKEANELIKNLTLKIVTEIEMRIPELEAEVGELLTVARDSERPPSNFGQVLAKTAEITKNLAFYNNSLRSFGPAINPRYTAAIVSYKRCFADIVANYVIAPATKAAKDATNAATFRQAFIAVEKSTKIMEDNRENLDTLLGGDFSNLATSKEGLQKALSAAAKKERNLVAKKELLQLEEEQDDALNPFEDAQRSKEINDATRDAAQQLKIDKQKEEMVPLETAKLRLKDMQFLAELHTWIEGIRKEYPQAILTEPRMPIGRSSNAQNHQQSSRLKYAPTVREETQNALKIHLYKSMDTLRKRQDQTSLSKEIKDMATELQNELVRWMTPEDILRDAQNDWGKESNAIEEVKNNLEGGKTEKDIAEAITQATSLRANLNEDPFSVLNRISTIPEAVVEKKALSLKVENKYAELQAALDFANQLLVETEKIKNSIK